MYMYSQVKIGLATGTNKNVSWYYLFYMGLVRYSGVLWGVVLLVWY